MFDRETHAHGHHFPVVPEMAFSFSSPGAPSPFLQSRPVDLQNVPHSGFVQLFPHD